MREALPNQIRAVYEKTQPQIFWRDAPETHNTIPESARGAQANPSAGLGAGLPAGFFGILGGDYPLSNVIPAALARSYLEFQAPEAQRKILLSVSPQELYTGDVFSAQLLFRPKYPKPTVNQGSESGSIARGSLNL
jgi:hypothetical protein